MRQLTSPDCAYLAGLVDGEGTVTLSRLHTNQQRYLVVAVCNCERNLLEWIIDATGVGLITRKRPREARHLPNFTWRVTSRRALGVLTQIVPYMRGYKRRRAEIALERYLLVTPRNGKYDERRLELRRDFEREFLSIRIQPVG